MPYTRDKKRNEKPRYSSTLDKGVKVGVGTEREPKSFRRCCYPDAIMAPVISIGIP